MPVSIRPAEICDVSQLHQMIHALARHHGDVPSVSQAELHRDLFTSPSWAKALVAEQATRLIGYAILVPLWRAQTASRVVDLHHLFVAQSQRGQGIGTRLIAAARTEARALGAKSLTIGTMPDNARAQAFYANLGMTALPQSGPRYVTPA